MLSFSAIQGTLNSWIIIEELIGRKRRKSIKWIYEGLGRFGGMGYGNPSARP